MLASGPSVAPTLSVSLFTRSRLLLRHFAAFGAVGGIAFLIDIAVYNLLRADVLADSPIWAKVASVTVATVASWIGSRYLTFRGSSHGSVVREAVLFGLMNVGGLVIAAACLYVSHYVLGFTSTLADNISGNVIGLVLGTIFRYAAYRYVVFPRTSTRTAIAD